MRFARYCTKCRDWVDAVASVSWVTMLLFHVPLILLTAGCWVIIPLWLVARGPSCRQCGKRL